MMRRKGFTIVELLAVLVILGIIMAITVPTISYFLRGNSKDYYSKLEKTVASSGQDFFNDYRVNLPKDIGNVKRLLISSLIEQKYTTDVVGIDKKRCDGDVVVQKLTNGNYSYTTCLKCEKKSDGSYGYVSDFKECGYSEENNNHYTILVNGLGDKTNIRIPQAEPYTVPNAKVFVNGQALANELRPMPGVIDTNILTTYKIYYTFRTLVKELQIEVYDPKKPVVGDVTLVSGGANYTAGTFTNKDVVVNLLATDWTKTGVYGSGVDHFIYQVNGGTNVKISATTTNNQDYKASFTLSTTGTHNVSVKAVDKQGNVSDTKTFVVKIDKVKPSGTVKVASTKSGYNALTVKATLSASDNSGGSGVKQMCIRETNTLSSCSWINYALTRNMTLSGSLDGATKTIYVWFKDGAGNISDARSTTYKVYKEGTTVKTTWSSCTKVCGKDGTTTSTVIDSFTNKRITSEERTISCNTNIDCCSQKKLINYTLSACSAACGAGFKTRTEYYRSKLDPSVTCPNVVIKEECTGTNCEAILLPGNSVLSHVAKLTARSNVKYIKTTTNVPSGAKTELVSITNSIPIYAYFDSSSSTLYFASTASKIYMNSDSSQLFYNYTGLVSIDFGKFDTSKVTNMKYMFRESTMTSLDLRSFDTSNVTTMSNMFYRCYKLESVNLSSFNTSKVTDMELLFAWCGSLKSLNLSNFNTSNVTGMTYMFYGCSKLTSLDLRSFNTSKVTGMGGMFFNCRGLVSLNVSSFNTSQVDYMGSMFSGCRSLTSLNLSSFNTSKVEYMESMFSGCESLTSLNVSSFNTSQVTNMSSMFSGCRSLTSLNLSNFNTANVRNMGSMFSGCNGLTSLNVSSFNTSNVTSMGGMFSGCWGLTSLNVSNFNTSKVRDMGYMFNNCSGLTSLNVSNFNTSEVTDMGNMFTNCYRLTSLNLSKFDTRKVTKFGAMFAYTNRLRSVTYGSNFVYQNNATLSAPVNITNVSGSISMFGNTPANKPTHSSWSGKI